MAAKASSDESNHSLCSGKRLYQFPPREVAQELCLIDAELLRRIQLKELEDGAWMKKDKKHEVSPNVLAMVGMFNQLALLIPTEILAEATPHARSKVISSYIQVASKCLSSHNYNSLKAVLAGLQCTPVFRLSRSWKEVSSRRRKRFQSLTRLMSEEENWQAYRKDLEPKLMSNSSFIPFLGVYLSDVAMYQEARSMARRMEKGSERRRSSNALYDTYTLLEPITIRHRLQRLRSTSVKQNSAMDTPPHSIHSDSDREEDTDLSYSTQSNFSPAQPTPLMSPIKLASLVQPTMEEGWNVEDWLKEVELDQYAQSFLDNGYETIELCAGITGADLTAIGVGNRQHRSILHAHARKLLVIKSCPGPNCSPVNLAEASLEGKDSFKCTLSGSLECLMSAVQHESQQLLVKSSSLRSITSQEVEINPPTPQLTHKRTHSDTPTIKTHSLRRVSSDTSTGGEQLHSFTGLPPQLPLHSHSGHTYSPNKTKTEGSPQKETPTVRFKNWFTDHHHRGSLPVTRKKNKELLHTYSSPVLPQRSRRTSGSVPKLRLSQLIVRERETKDPLNLLASYQLLSLGCSNGCESNAELRTLITKATHNTEAQNYKISYQLETA